MPNISQATIDDIYKQNADLRKKIESLQNNPAPTIPIYNPTHFPQDAVEGQIAIGNDDTVYFFRNGTWHAVGGSKPLIIDYFNNAGGDPFADDSPNPAGSAFGSTNYLSWTAQAAWTGYPVGKIGVAPTSGTDSFGRTIDRRFIYVDLSYTDGDPLIKIEFSMTMDSGQPDQWWNVRPHFWGTNDMTVFPWTYSDPNWINFGQGTDFPLQTYSTTLPSIVRFDDRAPTIWVYRPANVLHGRYFGITFLVAQSYPNAVDTDFNDGIYAQCMVTVMKNDQYAGSL